MGRRPIKSQIIESSYGLRNFQLTDIKKFQLTSAYWRLYKTVRDLREQYQDKLFFQNGMVKPLLVDGIPLWLDRCASMDWIYKVLESFSRQIECWKLQSKACHHDWMNIRWLWSVRWQYEWYFDRQQSENISLTQKWKPSALDNQQKSLFQSFFLNWKL